MSDTSLTNIPTAKEKRKQLADLPESIPRALLARIAVAIAEWTTGPKLVVQLSEDEYAHTDVVIDHLRSLGYSVFKGRFGPMPRDSVIVIEVPTHELFESTP